MNHVRTTFLHFLSDNLPGTIPIQFIRTDSTNPSSGVLKLNAVNVEFLDLELSTNFYEQPVAIDIMFDKEADAEAAVFSVWGLLKAAFYTRLLDYTDKDSPVDLGKALVWGSRVSFVKVSNVHYSHYSAVVKLMCTN